MLVPDITPKLYRATLASIIAVLTTGVSYSVWASHNGASPCPLCIFQRMLFMTLIALAFVALVLPYGVRKVILPAMEAVCIGGSPSQLTNA